MGDLKRFVTDWKSAMVFVVHAMSKHPLWALLFVCVDVVFFMFYYPFFHTPLLSKLQEVGFAAVLLIQSNIATLGLLDIFVLPDFRDTLFIFLGILLVLILVFYVMFTLYSFVKWNIASKILEFKTIGIRDMFMINAWWMLFLVGLRTVYFIIQVPFTIGKFEIVLGILEFVVILLMAKLWFWTLISYAFHSQGKTGVIHHSIMIGSSKKAFVAFFVLVVLAVVGNIVVGVFGALSLFLEWVTIIVVLVTIVYLLWLYLLIIRIIFKEVMV